MRDHLRPVCLFGRAYQWHKPPGQPLELRPVAPWPELSALSPAELYEETVRMMGGLLPWPAWEEKSSA